MKRYYFDLRDQDDLAVDEEGLELPDMDAVRAEAMRSIVDAVQDVTIVSGEIAVEVRDDLGPVMTARFDMSIPS